MMLGGSVGAPRGSFCFGSEEIRIRFCRLVNVGRLRVLSFLSLYAWGGGGALFCVTSCLCLLGSPRQDYCVSEILLEGSVAVVWILQACMQGQLALELSTPQHESQSLTTIQQPYIHVDGWGNITVE